MAAPAPLFATEATAAKLLDMRRTEFRQYVKEGVLPGPNRFDRWDVAELRAIVAGERVNGFEDVQW